MVLPTSRQMAMWKTDSVDAVGVRINLSGQKNYDSVLINYMELSSYVYGLEQTDSLSDEELPRVSIASRAGILQSKEVGRLNKLNLEEYSDGEILIKKLKAGRVNYVLLNEWYARAANRIRDKLFVKKSRALGNRKIYHWIKKRSGVDLIQFQKVLNEKMKFIRFVD